ncbi:MAG: hypothetical protein NVS2B3_02740 [Vulcanimicrobiaceae bacterium]
MIVTGTILLLCGVGLYASAFMTRKAARAARGELVEPSVVESPRARSLGGTSNATIGCAYYAALAIAAGLFPVPFVWTLSFSAALCAAAFSLYLAYSLLFVTRMPCAYCWTSHVVNWTLVALVFLARPG